MLLAAVKSPFSTATAYGSQLGTQLGTQLDANGMGSRSQLRVDQSAGRKRTTGQHRFASALASVLNVTIGFHVGPFDVAWRVGSIAY